MKVPGVPGGESLCISGLSRVSQCHRFEGRGCHLIVSGSAFPRWTRPGYMQSKVPTTERVRTSGRVMCPRHGILDGQQPGKYHTKGQNPSKALVRHTQGGVKGTRESNPSSNLSLGITDISFFSEI